MERYRVGSRVDVCVVHHTFSFLFTRSMLMQLLHGINGEMRNATGIELVRLGEEEGKVEDLISTPCSFQPFAVFSKTKLPWHTGTSQGQYSNTIHESVCILVYWDKYDAC